MLDPRNAVMEMLSFSIRSRLVTSLAGFALAAAGCLTPEVLGNVAQELRADEAEKEAPPAARQNALLRAYFRSRYLAFYRPQRFEPNSEFIENFVDRQIDAFLEDVQLQIKRLEDAYETAVHLQERLQTTPREEKARRQEVRKAFSAGLKEVGDAADSLGDRLWPIFEGLDRKKKLETAESLPEMDGTTARGLEFIGRQIEVATQRIRDYLFLSNNTVTLNDLNGTNMLVRLYWIEQTVKRLRKTIR